eukprot:7151740-Alexandrium_andersonii.AAC.1
MQHEGVRTHNHTNRHAHQAHRGGQGRTPPPRRGHASAGGESMRTAVRPTTQSGTKRAPAGRSTSSPHPPRPP